MTYLFNWLFRWIFQLAGYVTAFFSMLYNYFMQFFLYSTIWVIEWFMYIVSSIIMLVLYTLDFFLQCLINILATTIGGDLFGLVGLSVSLIENNIQAVLTVAPYAKMIGYILNLDALQGAFNCLLAFMLFWLAYRWFRVWVRG